VDARLLLNLHVVILKQAVNVIQRHIHVMVQVSMEMLAGALTVLMVLMKELSAAMEHILHTQKMFVLQIVMAISLVTL
jgi:hypothetical protein